MSDALYSTRLRWYNGYGIAMLYGKRVILDSAPIIGGEPVEYIDYTPEVRCCEIRHHACDRMKEMTHAEILEADFLLRTLVGGQWNNKKPTSVGP